MTYDPRKQAAKAEAKSVLHPHPTVKEESIQKALDAMKHVMREDIRKASLDEPVERSRAR